MRALTVSADITSNVIFQTPVKTMTQKFVGEEHASIRYLTIRLDGYDVYHVLYQKVQSWEVHGAFNGVVEEQEGHLLIGFIATDTVSTLSISRHKGVVLGHLFKCELTRVD